MRPNENLLRNGEQEIKNTFSFTSKRKSNSRFADDCKGLVV